MRAVIQRVTQASVTVNNKVISSIQAGICVLVGICNDDTDDDVDYLVNKILKVKLFGEEDGGKPWSKSCTDLDLEVLSVSQFTLFGTLYKGNKPDFHLAMSSNTSKPLYLSFLEKLKKKYKPEKIKDGEFGADMRVQLVNNGPVTVIVDSKIKKKEE